MLSRRRLIAATGVAATALLLEDRASHAATPPKETGLASEGLLAGRPGFQPRTTMPLPVAELPGFLSAAQLASHHAEYVRLAERLHSIETALRQGVESTSTYADLRRSQVATANELLLHELYFGGLGAKKVEPPRHIQANMSEHMGSFDSWRADFERCALVAKAWAVLLYDPYDDRWHNAVMDSGSDGVWIGENPLVVCDVSEHAFSPDHAKRETYVAAFLDHVDWEEVSRRYRAADRM
jgi:Fe-Mn family superoxide dismutase